MEVTEITLVEAPIENPGSIGKVQRYHVPLRKYYMKLRETPENNEATDTDYLKVEAYVSNETMGSEGLFPMMLLFGALPHPVRTTPSPTNFVVNYPLRRPRSSRKRNEKNHILITQSLRPEIKGTLTTPPRSTRRFPTIEI